MDDRDLRPRHHRNPARRERILDFLLMACTHTVGGLTLCAQGVFVAQSLGFAAW